MDPRCELDGTVLCLVGAGTEADAVGVSFAQRIADVIEAPLVVRPAPRRGAVDWPVGADRATIVVASGTRGPLAGMLRRDRSPAVASRLGVPVVLLPDALEPDWSSEIVCGVDSSLAARCAAQTASALAGRLGVPMALFHAHEPVPALAMAATGGGAVVRPIKDLDEESRESGWQLLEALDRATAKPARLRLRSGPPGKCLNDYATERGAPLIVLGAPQSGGVLARLLRSTAWDLAATATVPIMYVPEHFVPSW
jgi:nucleotide-binding universal stress UspA family protein